MKIDVRKLRFQNDVYLTCKFQGCRTVLAWYMDEAKAPTHCTLHQHSQEKSPVDAFKTKLVGMCSVGGLGCSCCNRNTRDKPVAARRARRQLRDDVRSDIEQQLEDDEGVREDFAAAESDAREDEDLPRGYHVRGDGLVVPGEDPTLFEDYE